ncbi:hypothetical protein [Bradyrhizobium sp. CCBAU 11357]|uniref:hypothetical protein n=1 Tax=Bradyrhizobium sp. CCBAU 11357 TaxID=1630808 RepID=UPI0023041DA2|nr:hypothetical protein [Bradyrhizobium sp. CCBAU 11357]
MSNRKRSCRHTGRRLRGVRIISDYWEREGRCARLIAQRIVGQMLPILSFGEQFPTSIGVMRSSLTAQRCHRAQATHSIHLLLPTFLFFPPYFLFLRRSHYDYGAELILLSEARFGFRYACKSRLDHNRRNPVAFTRGQSVLIEHAVFALQRSVMAVILRDCATVVFGAYFRLFL